MGWARVAVAVGVLALLVGGPDERRRRPRYARLALALVLALALAAGGVALAAWARLPADGGAGAFHVEVVGPTASLFNGTLVARNATAFSLLQLACERANLTMETQSYSGMGLYVRSVGGYAAHGASGWVYEVERSGAWVSGDRAADRYPVRAGEALRWSWTDGS